MTHQSLRRRLSCRALPGMSALTQMLYPVLLLVCLMQAPAALAEQVMFDHGEHRLSGHYLLPTGCSASGEQERDCEQPRGVIIFVHGDGATAYDAEGFYPLIWNRLRSRGFAIFSWDKPGVGASTGNWLNQTMADRQREVEAAILFVQQRYGYSGSQTGLFGFSQAGWVVPAVAADNAAVGFVVGVGFAIDWVQQGWYMSKVRFQEQGMSKAEIAQARVRHQEGIAFLDTGPDYQQYLSWFKRRQADGDGDSVMAPERYRFVLRNYRANALNDYHDIEQPLLLLLGEDDMNVDIRHTQRSLAPVFSSKDNLQFSVIRRATHGLLKSEQFNTRNPGLMFLLKLEWMQEDAFADDFFPVLERWLEARAN